MALKKTNLCVFVCVCGGGGGGTLLSKCNKKLQVEFVGGGDPSLLVGPLDFLDL